MMRTAAIAILCAAAFGAGAQTYRWTDEQGRVHYTNTPPPAGAKNVQVREAPGTAPEAAPAESYTLQQARKNFPVTLFSVPGCESCDEARKLLNERGIPFAEVSVVGNEQLEELKKIAEGNTVPVLVVGKTVRKAFEPAAYHDVLDAAGYPKTGVLPPRQQAAPTPEKPRVDVEPIEPPPPPGPYSPERTR